MDASEQAVASGQNGDALAILKPALDARLPDGDLWFSAARLCSFNNQLEESRKAFQIAWLLGCGRLDAEVGSLTLEARGEKAGGVAREFARRLESRPYDKALRSGLVLSLLRAGELAAANKALAPLVESEPDDVEVRMLAAQVKGSIGKVRQARSLYADILHSDPTVYDARAGLKTLRDTDQFGVSVGYEHSFLQDTSSARTHRADWQEERASFFWRRPLAQTYSLEYSHVDRFGLNADQLSASWSRGWRKDWIMRLSGGIALNGDVIPRWRAGGGLSYRVNDRLFVNADTAYLQYSDVDVAQIIPGVTWQWSPRWVSDARVYLSETRLHSGASSQNLTWLTSLSWMFSPQSRASIFYSAGDENAANLVRNLIGQDSFQSAGISLSLGWRHRWAIEPSFRYEIHKQFNLQAVGLNLRYAY
jgi:YaiO family outer membrane protein